MLLRFVRFNVVSAAGILVQLAVSALLVSGAGMHYLLGTAIAIEIAVLHNFAWHQRWTWADRPTDREGLRPYPPSSLPRSFIGSVFQRCLAFHAGNGSVSLFGSLALLPLLVATLHLHYLVANLATIAATGILNFLIGDRIVFARRRLPGLEP